MIEYISNIPKPIISNAMFLIGITLIVIVINRQITNKK